MRLCIDYCYLKNVLHKAIRFFKASDHVLNKKTLEAIDEGERIAYDPNVSGYRDMKSLFKALDS